MAHRASLPAPAGVLPVVLDAAVVDQLFAAMYACEGFMLTVDLEGQVVRSPSGEEFAFEVDEFRKHCLVHGLDDIGLTLQSTSAIRAYEQRAREQSPWLFDAIK